MTIATSKLTLTEFLAMPETKPASEYINGAICPKPMPKTRHSRLQSRLIRWRSLSGRKSINEVVETPQPDKQPQLYRDSDLMPVLTEIPLQLTAVAIFDWLKM